jgi:hypothetical protein
MRRTSAMLLLAIAACFSEPAPDDSCRPGAAGCDCRARTCDDGLECIASIDKCVPIDCDAGTNNCTCADGDVCFPPLVCMGGICHEVAGTSGVADGSGSASSQTITLETTSTGADASSSTTGGPLPDPVCLACVEMQWAVGSACSQHFLQCESDLGCAAIHTCYVMNGTQASCCEGTCGAPRMAWNGFLGCVDGQCPGCEVEPSLACPEC